MRCLNSPVGISPVDDYVLKEIPEGSKSGVVIGAGDGRLGEAIRERLGDDVAVYNVEPRKDLHEYIADKDRIGSDPWDYSWYEGVAKENGGFDFVILLNVHEYWDNELLALQQIFELLKPNGLGFLSFYNGSALTELGRSIPPFVTGYERLANPMNSWTKMDLSSWMIYLSDIGLWVDQVWGMMEKDAFDYCHKNVKTEVKWKRKGLEVAVKDIGDAFILGAPVICLRFIGAKPDMEAVKPKFMGIEYNASMFQAVLFPYLSVVNREVDAFKAKLEVDEKLYENEDQSHVFLDYFITLLDDFEKVKKVLVVGCGWGADLLALKKLKPEWEIHGADLSRDVIAAGGELMRKEGISTIEYEEDGSLSFKDEEFDLVLSLGHFSRIYHPLASKLAGEMIRVSKQGVVHLEDSRGPELSMELKIYSIPDIYQKLGHTSDVRSIKLEDNDSGMYVMKIKKK